MYYNLVNQDVTNISCTSENVSYPLSNLKHPFSSKVFRSTATSDSVVFDFGSVQSVDSIAVRSTYQSGWGHGDLTIEANGTDEWSSPAYTSTLSVDVNKDIAFTLLETAVNYRFWRITGTDLSNVFELSSVFIGLMLMPERNIDFNWSFDSKDLSKIKYNRYGQKFIDVIASTKSMTASIKLLSSTGMKDLLEMSEYLGTTKDLWVIVDNDASFSDSKELFAGQFYLKKKLKFINISFGLYNTTIGLGECI